MLTLKEQSEQLRRKRYVAATSRRGHMRLLLAIQVHVTNILIRIGINSRVVTASWFFVALAAYGFVAWGTPWSFVAGALLLYIKTILDISDGEIGRYQKQAMSETEDLTTHMQGIYLDRVLHAIESPLLGLALGWGAFRLTGSLWFVACGVGISMFLGFCRYDGLLRNLVVWQFHERWNAIHQTKTPDEATDRPRSHDGLLSRIFDKLVLSIRNGKRFNHVLLLCGAADWICSTTHGVFFAIPALVVTASILGTVEVLSRIVRVQFTDQLIRTLPSDFRDRDFE